MEENQVLKKVTIPFTEEEKMSLKIAAAKANKTITDFCREIIVQKIQESN